MIHDISNGLRLLTFRSPSNGSFSNSARAALVAIVVYLTVRLFGLAVQSWPIGGYEFWDIPNFLAILFIEFGVLLSILAAFGLGKGLVQAIIAYIALMSTLAFVVMFLVFFPADQLHTYLISLGIFVVLTLVYLVRLPKFVEGATWKLSISLFVGITASVFMQWPFAQYAGIFHPKSYYQADGSEGETSNQYIPIDIEEIYYAQTVLLKEQFAKLEPGQEPSSHPRLFTILGAGTAYQQVFLREARAVPQIVEDVFGVTTAQVQLANSRIDPVAFPLANMRNLEATFNKVASEMDTSKDVALVYLTSHGAPDQFSLSFYETGVKNMSSVQLANMLERSKLSNVVIVISACYAGSFIDELAAADRLIITASDSDSKSFGCSDASEWTWFGDAYFNQALRQTPDFVAAFEIARDLVASWESDADYHPSNSQMEIGSDILILLEELTSRALTQT